MAQELLLRAAERGDVAEATILLERKCASAGAVMPPINTTPLHAACRFGHVHMVELLLEHRASPNCHEIRHCGGRTPLHMALRDDLLTMAQMLLHAGANPVARDGRGLTPLHLAAQEGLVEATRLLLAHGGDPHMRDFSGFNPAWWAKEFKQDAVLQLYTEMEVVPRKISPMEHLAHAGISIAKLRPKKKKDKREKSEGKKRSSGTGTAAKRAKSAR